MRDTLVRQSPSPKRKKRHRKKMKIWIGRPSSNASIVMHKDQQQRREEKREDERKVKDRGAYWSVPCPTEEARSLGNYRGTESRRPCSSKRIKMGKGLRHKSPNRLGA